MESAITVRLEAAWVAEDECQHDPPNCDIDAIIAEYSTPDSPAADLWRTIHNDLVANSEHVTDSQKIERHIASMNADGANYVSQVCIRDGSAIVAADGSVLDNSLAYYRLEWVWSQVDGRWIVVGGHNRQINATGSAVCDTYFQ